MSGRVTGRARASVVIGVICTWLLGGHQALAWPEQVVFGEEPSEGVTEPSLEAPPPPTTDELLANLSNPEVLVRVQAIQALALRPEAQVISRLAMAATVDPIAEVRGWALRALHQIDTLESRHAGAEAARGERDERVLDLAARLFPPVAQARAASEARSAVRSAHQRRDLEGSRPRVVEPPPDPGRSFKLSGWLTFAISFAATVSMGLVTIGYDPTIGGVLLVPFVGPVITAGINHEGDLNPIIGIGVALAVAQVTGFTLALIGQTRSARAHRDRAARVALVPSLSAQGAALRLVGRF